MSLTRESLTPAWVERFATAMREEGSFTPLDDDQREASLRKTLAALKPGEDVWIFGYGSLMWNPILQFDVRREGRIHGYHRRFCIWLPWGRGTRESPGLMLGLDRGGSCRGVAFRIPTHEVDRELRLLWMREMISGVYRPVWVKVRDGNTVFRAITFVVDRCHPLYTGPLSCGRTAKLIGSGKGWLGTSREYLENTLAGLAGLGMRDSYLDHLAWHLGEKR